MGKRLISTGIRILYITIRGMCGMCVDEKGEKIPLGYRGYDKRTDSLRYGFHPARKDKRIFRIKCEEDRRIFTPVARDSHKWKRLYNMRSGIERINGRLDRDYKYEKLTIRGLGKMKMFMKVPANKGYGNGTIFYSRIGLLAILVSIPVD